MAAKHRQKVKTLNNVARVTEKRVDEARLKQQEVERQLSVNRSQLHELERYFTEYTQNIGFAAEGRNRAFALQNYQQFMSRIEQTVEQQRNVVRQLEQRLEQTTDAVRAANVQHRSVGKLTQRYQHRIQQDDEKQEQAMLDQFGLHNRHRGGPGK